MSYTIEDAAWDEAYDRLVEDLYDKHREQAIAEFTHERLRSYYVAHPDVLIPAVGAFRETGALLANGHFTAAYVFAATAIEQFLKASLLRPVVYGLVHNEALAGLVVESALSQTGFLRYQKLLSGLFLELKELDLKSVRRPGATKPLLDEVRALQEARNDMIHDGMTATEEQARWALDVATQVFNDIVADVLAVLDIELEKGGRLRPTFRS